MDVTATDSDFTALAEAYSADVYRYAFWLCRDPHVAEDLVQETFLRAFKARTRLKDASKAKAWLLTIVRRENARRFDRLRPDLVDVDAVPLAGDQGVGDRPVDDMRRAIFDLDEAFREPLVMQVLFGYTTNEIAEHMGLTQGAVLTRLFRARKQLQAAMGTDAGAAGRTGERG